MVLFSRRLKSLKLLRRCYACRRIRVTYWEAECKPTLNNSKNIETSRHAIQMKRRTKRHAAAWRRGMISDAQMKVIVPKEPTAVPSSAHVQAGVPIPKAIRVRHFSPDEWEEFVEEWATTLEESYVKVRRFGGAGDCGVDIAGFCTSHGFEGTWDNYQCKRYGHPLRPSDVWTEIGKIIYYSHIGEYSVPRAHYFVASNGVGTTLEKLLSKTEQLTYQLHNISIRGRVRSMKHEVSGSSAACGLSSLAVRLSHAREWSRISVKSYRVVCGANVTEEETWSPMLVQ